MTTLIIGAGLSGLTTAYNLITQKQPVLVVEKLADVGCDTSFANGAQLSYSYIDPLASWSMVRKLPAIFLGRDPHFIISPKAINGANLLWFMQFIRQCSASNRQHNLHQLAKLALTSQQAWQQLPKQVTDNCHFRQSGKLVFYRSVQAFEQAKFFSAYKKQLGLSQQILTAQQCIELEPQLEHLQADIAGGIYAATDSSADSYQFCKALNKWLLDSPYYSLQLNTGIEKCHFNNKRITAVTSTGGKNMAVDKLVVAGGMGSITLLRGLGIKLSVAALKGHSVSLAGQKQLKCSITDFENKTVFSHLGNKLRIAGQTELIANSSTKVSAKNIQQLLALGSRVLPEAADYEQIQDKWAGIRVCTPNSLPILANDKYSNLWLNMAHNFLGFTLALGCAQQVANLVINGDSTSAGSSRV